MRDCFGCDVTTEELQRWDANCVPLWNGRADSWEDIPFEKFRGSEGFWVTDVPVDPATLNGKRVLELGCGIGRCAPHVVAAGASYTGLDVSKVALHIARSRTLSWPRMRFLHTVANAKDPSLREGQWDLIFGTSFFIHQEPERRRQLLAVASSWLSWGGRLSLDYWPGEDKVNASKAYGDWEAFTATTEALIEDARVAGLNFVSHTEPSENRSYLVFTKEHPWHWTEAETNAWAPDRIVGARSFVSREAFVDSLGGVEIGSDCIIAPGATILGHDASPKVAGCPNIIVERTFLGDRVFVGRGAIIMPGLRIGSNTVIGAGAVVTADVPGDVVMVGNPARVVCTIGDYAERCQGREHFSMLDRKG